MFLCGGAISGSVLKAMHKFVTSKIAGVLILLSLAFDHRTVVAVA